MSGTTIKPGETIGHFRIETQLGVGGMGAVYVAQDLTLSRKVAIKFMNRSLLVTQGDASIRDAMEKRFIREAQSAAAINHPNLAQIYEANFESDNWYIAMEMIDGASLHDLIEGGKTFVVDEIIDICMQTVKGLDYAWKKYKIVHRDIKPHNIMVTSEDLVKIVDLGLAKPMDKDLEQTDLPELTQAGTPVGTPQYMAPEQAAGRCDITYQVDIFALGATLYEMCTGKRAFRGATIPMIYVDQLKKKYRPINEVNSGIPDFLVQLIDDMLEPKPEDRIDSYDSIVARLRGGSPSAATVSVPRLSEPAPVSAGASYTLDCPSCSQELDVSAEYSGMQVYCPRCNTLIQVPDLDAHTVVGAMAPVDAAHTVTAHSEIHESLSAINSAPQVPISSFVATDDLEYLQGVLGSSLHEFDHLQPTFYWELAVVSELLSKKLQPLKECIVDSTTRNGDGAASRRNSRGDYHQFVESQFHEFSRLITSLYTLFAEDLVHAVGHENLKPIFSVANKFGKLIAELQQLHSRVAAEPVPREPLTTDLQHVLTDWLPDGCKQLISRKPLPEEDQYQEINRMMTAWAPHCHVGMENMIHHLRQSSLRDRDTEVLQIQCSIIPNNLTRFFILAARCRIGKTGPKSVAGEISAAVLQ